MSPSNFIYSRRKGKTSIEPREKRYLGKEVGYVMGRIGCHNNPCDIESLITRISIGIRAGTLPVNLWKPRMIAFLRSLDSKVRRVVNKGWEHPTKTGEDGVSVQIPEEEWDKEQEALALGNSKALNALFNGISKNIFRLVHHCELAKEVGIPSR
ncbi:hypothetical protein KIW84_034694 [Lathyrus oleraceus]|uniref:Uncharacterized protein n=1 Tax=Pisum sativum TaxID=3888 RepID=A0A9D4Y104_PEA|nr:hypothetical protein KIW84_034694 [Pisum sativum]